MSAARLCRWGQHVAELTGPDVCLPTRAALGRAAPVMLGRGKRWYSGDPATARSWTLVEQAHSPNGVHFASFARDGEVRTGSFATKPPSEAELALRQRQAEGRW